jgi:iron(III) transport system substrate-binding protein
MPRRRLLILLSTVALALGALGLAGCGGDEDGLVVYSGRSEELVGPIYERFEEETGINLDIRYGGSTDLALLMAEEGADTPADVFISQSPGTVAFLEGRGLLGEVPRAALDKVPARVRDRQGLWVGITGRQRVLVYNPGEVDAADLPDSVLDLTQPAFRGRVGVAPSNASFQDFVTALRLSEGEEAAERWLRGMASNGARPYANNLAIVDAVARGEVPMGLVNHYYIFQKKAEDPDLPIAIHRFPGGDIGSLFLVSTASIPVGTDRREEAERLVEYLLTPESQRVFAEADYEYPVIAGVRPAEGVPPLASLDLPPYDFGTLADLERTAQLIRESGIEG